MKKYQVAYGKCKVAYTAESLERLGRTLCFLDDDYEDDGEYLSCAMHVFCATHFMFDGDARLELEDAATRGRRWMRYAYQPYGAFRDWIDVEVIDA